MQDSKNAGKYAYLNAGIVHELPDFVGILFEGDFRDNVKKYIYIILWILLLVHFEIFFYIYIFF